MLILLLITACSNPPAPHYEIGGRSETGQPALHAIHDEKLHELMRRMDSLMQERFMTETQLDKERRRYSQRIADTARGLSETVDVIIGQMPKLALSADEQSTFLSLAKKLRQLAVQLHQQASGNQIDAIDESLHQINTTCMSCHALFRNTGE